MGPEVINSQNKVTEKTPFEFQLKICSILLYRSDFMQLPSTSGYTGNENGLKIIDKTFSHKQ